MNILSECESRWKRSFEFAFLFCSSVWVVGWVPTGRKRAADWPSPQRRLVRCAGGKRGGHVLRGVGWVGFRNSQLARSSSTCSGGALVVRHYKKGRPRATELSQRRALAQTGYPYLLPLLSFFISSIFVVCCHNFNFSKVAHVRKQF